MTTIRMYYNPYLCSLKARLIVSEGAEQPFGGNVDYHLNEKKYGERFVLEDDANDLLKIFAHACRGSKITVEFASTERCYEKFRKICEDYEGITTEFCEEHRILPPEEINRKITDMVKDLKAKGFDVDSQGEIEKILDAEIPVVVVGSMSSGKSTFINALIGDELLPSEQNPETGLICEIHNSKERSISYVINGAEVNIDACSSSEKIESMDNLPEELKEELLKEPEAIGRIRAVIKYYNFKDKTKNIDRTVEIDGKKVIIHCPFYSKDMPENIVFYDTPGGDSDSNEDDAVTLGNALSNQTKGFIVFVCAERSGMDKSKDLIETVQKNTGNKLDLAHTVVIVNKTETTPKASVETSLEREWTSRIIYTSSAIGLGARKEENPAKPNPEKWTDQDLRKRCRTDSCLFSDANDPDYLSLPKYATLPESRSANIAKKEDALKANAESDSKAKAELIQFNSGITVAESEIAFVANELFPYNQCARARDVFKQLLDKYKEDIAENEQKKKEQKKEKRKEFEKLYNPICKELEEVCENFKDTSQQEFKDNYWRRENSFKTKKQKKERKKKNKENKDFTDKLEDFFKSASYKKLKACEIKSKILGWIKEDLEPFIKDTEDDFDLFIDDMLPRFSAACMKKINSQSDLTEEEKSVFKDFFKSEGLIDRTEKNRTDAFGEFNLKLSDLHEALNGNLFEKIKGIFLKKGVKKDIEDAYDNSYSEFTDDIIEQINSYIANGFNNIKQSFKDKSSINYVICERHLKLRDIKERIDDLDDEISELEHKTEIVNGMLDELKENIFK